MPEAVVHADEVETGNDAVGVIGNVLMVAGGIVGLVVIFSLLMMQAKNKKYKFEDIIEK